MADLGHHPLDVEVVRDQRDRDVGAAQRVRRGLGQRRQPCALEPLGRRRGRLADDRADRAGGCCGCRASSGTRTRSRRSDSRRRGAARGAAWKASTRSGVIWTSRTPASVLASRMTKRPSPRRTSPRRRSQSSLARTPLRHRPGPARLGAGSGAVLLRAFADALGRIDTLAGLVDVIPGMPRRELADRQHCRSSRRTGRSGQEVRTPRHLLKSGPCDARGWLWRCSQPVTLALLSSGDPRKRRRADERLGSRCAPVSIRRDLMSIRIAGRVVGRLAAWARATPR